MRASPCECEEKRNARGRFFEVYVFRLLGDTLSFIR